jgi:hypothetical protein
MDRKEKQVLSRGWYQWEEGRHMIKVEEGEYDGNIMCSCVKMEK